MLVLRRRVGEKILVGNEVEIEVIEISRSRVKLGVRAPCQISVIRKETLAVSQENQLASDLIAARGHDGVGELLQLLHRNPVRQAGSEPAGPDSAGSTRRVVEPVELKQTDSGESSNQRGLREEGSTKSTKRRYVTPERYSGYRGSRENPHPA